MNNFKCSEWDCGNNNDAVYNELFKKKSSKEFKTKKNTKKKKEVLMKNESLKQNKKQIRNDLKKILEENNFKTKLNKNNKKTKKKKLDKNDEFKDFKKTTDKKLNKNNGTNNFNNRKKFKDPSNKNLIHKNGNNGMQNHSNRQQPSTPMKNNKNKNNMKPPKKLEKNVDEPTIEENGRKEKKLPPKRPILDIRLSLKKQKQMSLRERMLHQLTSSRFRYLNEQFYTTTGKDALKIFSEDSEAFKAYHDGFRQQVEAWPTNPLDVIINDIKKMPKTKVIADFGCGEGKLAQSVPHQVHSFDLVALNDWVVACDMSHVPLENDSVDVAVFCLSLMGTNLHDYIREANRVLKIGGLLKIAEVESRFGKQQEFIEAMKRFNFKKIKQNLSVDMFYFFDFRKEANIKRGRKLPTVSLNPCLYKKR